MKYDKLMYAFLIAGTSISLFLVGWLYAEVHSLKRELLETTRIVSSYSAITNELATQTLEIAKLVAENRKMISK